MWVITDGIDGGISEMIGDAFNEELASRDIVSPDHNLSYLNTADLNVFPLTLIGIVNGETLQNISVFDGHQQVVNCPGNKIGAGNTYRFDMNSDHNKLIIFNNINLIENNIKAYNYSIFRSRVESLLTRPMSYYRKLLQINTIQELIDNNNINMGSDDEDDIVDMNKDDYKHVPMVCLVLGGDLATIDAVEYKMKKEIPCVIFQVE
jgi:hypothetical protein